MASLKETLELLVTANVGGAVSGLEKVGSTAEKELGKAESSMSRVGGKMQMVGAGMLGVGAIALSALGGLAHAAEEAELASLKLSNSLKNAPQIADKSSQAFDDLATSLMKTTVFDDEATKGMMAYLIQTGRTREETLQLTPAIQDLAAKMSGDLDGAAKSVTLALSGKKKGLEAIVGPLDAALYKTDRYAAVMQGLAKVQGFAAEQGKTFDGQLQILQNQLGELAEGVGVGVVKAFEQMFSGVESVTGALDSLSPGLQSGIGQWATYGATGLVVLGAFNLVVGTLIKTATTLGIHTTATVADTIAVDANTAALEANAGASVAVVGAWAAVAVGAAALTFKAATDTVDEFSFSLNGVVPTVEQWQQGMAKIRESNTATGLSMYDFGHQIAKESIPAAQNLATALGETTPEALDVKRAIDDLGQASDEAKAKVEGLTIEQYKAKQASIDQAAAVKELHDQLHASIDPLFAMQKAVLDNKKAQEDATAAQKDGKHSSDEIATAQIQAAQSALAVHDAAVKLASAMQTGDVSTEGMTSTLQGMVDTGVISQETMNQLVYSMGGVVGKAEDLFAYDNKTVTINADTSAAQAGLNAIASTIRSMTNQIIHVTLGMLPGHNAAGTDSWRGGPTFVHEQGGEIIDLPSGSRIIPHDVSMSMAMAGAAQGLSATGENGEPEQVKLPA